MKKQDALIIIDVQNDFCPGGALAVKDGDSVVPVINSLSGRFNTVVVTQDWHPAGHLSFASSHSAAAPYDTFVLPDGTEQTLWPDHCVAGTEGAQFHPALQIDSADLILRKGTNPDIDSYSAFLENDRITVTGLQGYLSARGVTEVYICGLATDYCVFFSAMDAADSGFSPSVVIDACRGIDVPEGNIAGVVSTMEKRGIVILESGDM